MVIKINNVTIRGFERSTLNVYVNPDHIVDFYAVDDQTIITLPAGAYYVVQGDKTAELAKIIATATNTKVAVL